MSLKARLHEQQRLGYWRIFAQAPGGTRREITMFRGAPTQLSTVTFQDPFTDQTASLSIPQVTVFDQPGQGDLDWLVPYADVDIIWQNYGDYEFAWSFEGFIISMDFSLTGTNPTFNLSLKGALYALDNYLAIPSFPKRPIPYEILMAMDFDQIQHPCNLGPFQVLFPSDWATRVPEYNNPDYLAMLKPWGVATNQLWTGLTSRSTGSWEPLLTGHVQSLLTVMFAEGGAQWTVRNRGNRSPELHLRTIPDPDDPDIIEIQLGSPGVEFQGSKDWSQHANVIYGQGVDTAGISFSGMEVAPDGSTTYYKPFAFGSAVWPRTNNPSLDKRFRTKETMVRFQDGVDELSALQIAQGQYQRFSEPGITGSITLTTDQRYQDGTICPHLLIRAAKTVRIKGLFGIPEGVLAHITQVSQDFSSLTTTLTYDTKYRDQLTVAEVIARTRDALTPMRSLQVGKYSNTVQDLVLPWSYSAGSGMVPTGAQEFFNEKLPSTAEFPYEDWTTQYPPSNPAYAPYYISINPTDTSDCTNNWCSASRNGLGTTYAIPIRMAQSGTIKLTQIAAYDKTGHLLPVRFHASVYSNNGVGPTDTPRFNGLTQKFLAPEGTTVNYGAGQPNPFIEGAWEQTKPDGTQQNDGTYLLSPDAGLVIGWGNYYEPAGYSPGRFSTGAVRTGVLEDATTWTWDLSSTLDLTSAANNQNQEWSGQLFLLIYCDEQLTQPVYFQGRFLRQEPGTS